ncbi:hypothetical protein DCL27_17330 (plasmid) [Edwardsiella tarda ATCC 15947 = NBRC 105688]|uniref:Uncharacterized protein n=1 Tax=Edwardsiella tarda ATCC 15947 = NBRC 105688 TaxID=667121 RepID=A0AC61TNQ6_EDWTA|nr:hypothetical protein DCL27_17330 [Edwardsiella tarda ATCC 15947 = NBRC 105688]
MAMAEKLIIEGHVPATVIR